MKFRKKPVVIEAFIYGVDKEPDWFNNAIKDNTIELLLEVDRNSSKYFCIIDTLEGKMKASYLDYIILGVKGEIYPCKADIFEMTYNKEETTFYERLELEFNELEDKLNKLNTFIGNEGFGKLDYTQKMLLDLQSTSMHTYLRCLEYRLININNTKS